MHRVYRGKNTSELFLPKESLQGSSSCNGSCRWGDSLISETRFDTAERTGTHMHLSVQHPMP